MSKTVLDLSLEEIEEYRRYLKEREREILKSRFQKAWSLARDISVILKRKYEAKKVLVFGSLVDESRFNRWSDIDIAVLGIPTSKYLKALAEIISMGNDFKIDMIDLEDCKDSLKETIEKEGIEI